MVALKWWSLGLQRQDHMGTLLEMQILWLTSDLQDQKVGPWQLVFAQGFLVILMFAQA